MHEKLSLSVGMQIYLEGTCKASFGNAGCVTLQPSPVVFMHHFQFVTEGAVCNK